MDENELQNDQKRLKNGVIFFKMTILRSFSTFVEKIEFIHGQPTQSIEFPEEKKILDKIGRKKKGIVLCG